jgi:hypothetical protein
VVKHNAQLQANNNTIMAAFQRLQAENNELKAQKAQLVQLHFQNDIGEPYNNQHNSSGGGFGGNSCF